MNRVLVILVTHNGRKWLDRCLSSVAGTADVYVLDNDSTDGTPDWIQGHFPAVKLVRSAENLGFTTANNLGMEYALSHGYDYVYLLNQDAWLEAGALQKLVDFADANPSYAILSPLQMTDGYLALDKNFAKSLRRPEGRLFRNRRFATPPIKWAPPSYAAEGGTDSGTVSLPDVLPTRFVMAAHWLVRVSVIREVGMFSELFPMWGQDDNYCDRVRYRGYKVGVVPGARAVHDREYRVEPKEKLIQRNYYMGSLVRMANPAVPLWAAGIYVLLFTLVKAAKYRSLLVFKYFREINKSVPKVKALRAESHLA